MKIAVIARSMFSGNADPISRLTEGLLKNLSQLYPQEQFFLLSSHNVAYRFNFHPNINLVVVKPSGQNPLLNYWWYQVRLAKALNKIKPDVLLFTESQTLYKTPVPRVTLLWDMDNHFPPGAGNFFNRQYHQRYGLKSVQSSAKLITFLESSRQPLAETYQVAPERLTVIFPAANQTFKQINFARQVQVREAFAQGESYFLLTGLLQPGKDLDVILQGFALLKEKTRNDLKLVVLRNNREKDSRLAKAIKQISAPESVRVIGPVSEETLTGLYGTAVGTIYLPGYADVGLPVLEAQQCGCPVISLNHNLVQELAGNIALVITEPQPENIFQAMGQVYHDLELRAQLIAKGLANTRQFTWAASSREVMKILAEVNKTKNNALALL